MFNRDYGAKPYIQSNAGIGSIYDDPLDGINQFFPQYAESKIFGGHFASGLEVFANYMMAGTGYYRYSPDYSR